MGANKTPDEWDAWRATMRARHDNGNGHGDSLAVEVQRLFPSPDASAAKFRVSGDTQQSRSLAGRAARGELLLPTPHANASTGAGRSGREGGPNLQTVADGLDPPGEQLAIPMPGDTEWGPYTMAVERWEAITGRTAPAPTQPGAKGPRLSVEFTEWLMGLPDGWVTGVPGLSYAAQLRMLGNGVVPQQCAAALVHLGVRELVAAWQ